MQDMAQLPKKTQAFSPDEDSVYYEAKLLAEASRLFRQDGKSELQLMYTSIISTGTGIAAFRTNGGSITKQS